MKAAAQILTGVERIGDASPSGRTVGAIDLISAFRRFYQRVLVTGSRSPSVPIRQGA